MALYPFLGNPSEGSPRAPRRLCLPGRFAASFLAKGGAAITIGANWMAHFSMKQLGKGHRQPTDLGVGHPTRPPGDIYTVLSGTDH